MGIQYEFVVTLLGFKSDFGIIQVVEIQGYSMSESKTNVNKEPIDESEMTPDDIYDGCEKWFNIIHSLHLPSEVLNDSNKMEAILREMGVRK